MLAYTSPSQVKRPGPFTKSANKVFKLDSKIVENSRRKV